MYVMELNIFCECKCQFDSYRSGETQPVEDYLEEKRRCKYSSLMAEKV